MCCIGRLQQCILKENPKLGLSVYSEIKVTDKYTWGQQEKITHKNLDQCK